MVTRISEGDITIRVINYQNDVWRLWQIGGFGSSLTLGFRCVNLNYGI